MIGNSTFVALLYVIWVQIIDNRESTGSLDGKYIGDTIFLCKMYATIAVLV